MIHLSKSVAIPLLDFCEPHPADSDTDINNQQQGDPSILRKVCTFLLVWLQGGATIMTYTDRTSRDRLPLFPPLLNRNGEIELGNEMLASRIDSSHPRHPHLHLHLSSPSTSITHTNTQTTTHKGKATQPNSSWDSHTARSSPCCCSV